MSTLCGWLWLANTGAPPAHVLATMADAFRGRRRKVASICSTEAAIWATAEQVEGALCNAMDPWVGIVASPSWRNTALADEQRARGSAAALRRAYRDYGLDLFNHLIGAFAFAIVDPSTRKGLIAVDRMGIQSLYFSSHRDG